MDGDREIREMEEELELGLRRSKEAQIREYERRYRTARTPEERTYAESMALESALELNHGIVE